MGGEVGCGCADVAAEGEAVGFHVGDDGLLEVEGKGHHGDDDGDLGGADRVGVVGGEQGEGEEEIEGAGGEPDAVEREQRAADDGAGEVGVGQRLEGDLRDGQEEDDAADPEGERDEAQGAERQLHARGAPVRAGSWTAVVGGALASGVGVRVGAVTAGSERARVRRRMRSKAARACA